jgi:hypothetical protein
MQVQLTWLSPNPENKLIDLLNTTNATRGAETDPLPEQLREKSLIEDEMDRQYNGQRKKETQ